MADKNYIYYVEGQCEEKLLKTLKTDMQLIHPGKILKYNVMQEKLKKAQLRTLKKGTAAVLVFDTDTNNINILKENISILKNASAISKIICVTQVENLEDEIVRSCDVNNAQELTNSKSVSSFKSDFIKASNLKGTLEKHKFCFETLWSKTSKKNEYSEIVNGADEVRAKVKNKNYIGGTHKN